MYTDINIKLRQLVKISFFVLLNQILRSVCERANVSFIHDVQLKQMAASALIGPSGILSPTCPVQSWYSTKWNQYNFAKPSVTTEKKAIQHRSEGVFSIFNQKDFFYGDQTETWAKAGTSSVRITFTMAREWFTRREALLFPVLDETFISRPSVDTRTCHLYTRHVAPSQTHMLPVRHQIQHSPRQRLGSSEGLA